VLVRGSLDDRRQHGRGWFFEEQLGGDGKSREDIEQHDKLESKQSEGARYLGEVHHPDMIRRFRFQDTFDCLDAWPRLRLSRLLSRIANRRPGTEHYTYRHLEEDPLLVARLRQES